MHAVIIAYLKASKKTSVLNMSALLTNHTYMGLLVIYTMAGVMALCRPKACVCCLVLLMLVEFIVGR